MKIRRIPLLAAISVVCMTAPSSSQATGTTIELCAYRDVLCLEDKTQ